MEANNTTTIKYHPKQVKNGKRRFENAYQSVARMILEDNLAIEKVVVNGMSTFDFKPFRIGQKHVIGMYDESNSFVSFVKDAAEGGSSREMAYVIVGEPGNGKTFSVDFLCSLYRNFHAEERNRRYTFNFNNLDELSTYDKISTVQSQTFEDPMILAMNLFDFQDKNKEFLLKCVRFTNKQIETLCDNYRPLGA